MAELNKYGNKWLNSTVLRTRTAYRTAYAYPPREMDKRRRKKAKGDDENDEKTLVFRDVF